MPISGRKPKPPGQAVNRKTPVQDWVEVPDRPYRGRKPALFTKRRVMLPFGNTVDLNPHALTKAWWRDVSAMPHCALWSDSDWRYALATALVADAFHYGHTPSATELARREKVMGLTVDARRDLRIRYVEAKVESTAEVTSLDDYRDL